MTSASREVLNLVEMSPEAAPPSIVRHQRPRAVDSGKLDESRRRLHLLREEIGLTVYDLVKKTQLSYGTVLYNFWSGRSKSDVHPKIRAVIEADYDFWRRPDNVARREQLSGMTLREIISAWAGMLGAPPDEDLHAQVRRVAKTLRIHELTVQRQIDGKRERWSPVRIFNHEQAILAAAARETSQQPHQPAAA